MDKTKIKISYDAYYRFMDAIHERDEFNCLRLELPEKGCGAKLDIYLDKISKKDEVTDFVDELPIIYSDEVKKSFLEIIIVYRDNDFKIKTKGINDDLSGLFTPPKKSCGCGKHKK